MAAEQLMNSEGLQCSPAFIFYPGGNLTFFLLLQRNRNITSIFHTQYCYLVYNDGMG